MWQFNLPSSLLLASGMVSVITAIFVAAKPAFPGKLSIILMMVMGAEWSVSAGLEAAAPDIASKIFWSQVEYIGSMFGPVLYCYFIMGFLQKTKDGFIRYIWLLWIIPVLTILIGATNGSHGFLWTGFSWESREYNSLAYHHGPWFWVAVSYAFGLVFFGGLMLIQAIMQFPGYFRRQAWYLVVGSAMPVITTLIYVTGLSPFGGFDISPIGFLFAGLLFVSGIIRKQMFDLLPIAHHVILENLSAGVLVLDEHRRVLDLNPATCDILQIKNTIIGKNVIEMIPDLRPILERLSDNDNKKTEVKMTDPDRWIEVSLTPIMEKNATTEGSLIMLRDITTRIKYEQKLNDLNLQLSDSEKKLQELNAQKDKLFSVIAHDLKNPFNALLGFSRILHEESSEMGAEEVHKISGHLLKASRQGYDILVNLLEWSRAQTNRIEFNLEAVPLQELIAGSISNMEFMIRAKSINLEVKPFPETNVMIDRHMIETVLRNLLSNAVKFSHRNGKIILSAEPSDDFYSISVRDYGVGIKAEDLKKIFLLEYLYTSKGTEDEHGSGLGLILCKDFVEKNGGSLKVDSMIGQGSIFTFTVRES